MQKIVKNTLLKYAPVHFEKEKNINSARVFEINNNPVKSGKIIYVCEREIREKDNFAFQFALQKSKELNSELKIIHPKISYKHLPKQKFIDKKLLMKLPIAKLCKAGKNFRPKSATE